jgi:hypothetical protein
MLIGPISSGACVGADGAAVALGATTLPVRGLIFSVYVKYSGDKPATTDVIIRTKGTNAPTRTILTLTNKITDGLFLPRIDGHSVLGVADGAANQLIPVEDIIEIAVAEANTGDIIEAWLMVLPA